MAIDGEQRSATVEAIEPVEALALATIDFRAYLIAHPEIALPDQLADTGRGLWTSA